MLRDGEGLAVIDGVQRMLEPLEILRPISDDPIRKAVSLLSQSASLDFVRGISEALAGRIRLTDVNGFSLSAAEQQSRGRLRLRGGFARAYIASTADARTRWMESFTRMFADSEIGGASSCLGK